MTEHLHFEVVGDQGKPDMLLIHGFMTSKLQWILNQQALSRHFRLIMVDTWGHGDSPAPDDPEAYSADNYMRELERIRTQLDVDKWVVVGQSFGAGISMTYALRFPQHVHGVIFTNSKSAIGNFGKNRRALSDRSAVTDLRSLRIHPIHAKRIAPELKEQFVAVADAVDLKAAHLGPRMGHTISCRDKIHQLTVPALLCNGIYEKGFQEDVAFARQAQPSLQVVELEAGHSTNLDAPEAFNEAVISFCRKTLGLISTL